MVPFSDPLNRDGLSLKPMPFLHPSGGSQDGPQAVAIALVYYDSIIGIYTRSTSRYECRDAAHHSVAIIHPVAIRSRLCP